MGSFRSSFLASGVAALVVAAITMEKNALGFIPGFTMPRAWGDVLGMADQPWVGWIAYILFGIVVCGIAFAALYSALPGRSPVMKGFVFGALIWLVTMIVFMPLAGVGLFASDIGNKLVAFNLATNLIFGIVLGAVYKWDDQPAPVKPVAERR